MKTKSLVSVSICALGFTKVFGGNATGSARLEQNAGELADLALGGNRMSPRPHPFHQPCSDASSN